MELKQFVKTVLTDVCEAVHEAKIESLEIAAIAPGAVKGKVVDKGQLVSFEVLVNVTNSVSGDGRGKIEVIGLSGGVEGSISKATENSSRIQFQVPVYFSGRMDRVTL